ncbi:MAG: SDR family NAD(P)-dependent oxidoreductase, partial [Gemmatimonadaceae bacterium]
FDAPRASTEPAESIPAANERRADIADWFYHPSWKRTLIPAVAAIEGERQNFLMFVESGDSGKSLVDAMRRDGRDIVAVTPGSAFARRGRSDYAIGIGAAADFDSLLAGLRGDGVLPHHIIHAWNLDGDGDDDRSFFSLMFLAQAIGRENLTDPIRLDVLSSNMQHVAGESALHPRMALLLGPCRVIPSEFPNISARSIDVADWSPSQQGRQLELIARELSSDGMDRTVAYRDGDRWVETMDSVRLEAGADTSRIRESGVYVITGGLGGIGFSLAEHLARTARARVVLMGRSTEGAEEKISVLEKLGAEVMVVAVDVTVESEVRTALSACRSRFGNIHGVFHAAGTLDDELILARTRSSSEAVMAPKVTGTIALDAALGDAPLDFMVLFSSVSAMAGIPGQVDYAGANAFLDAFAHARRRRSGAHTVAIDWAAWRDVGMVGTKLADAPSHPLLERVVSSSPQHDLFAANLGVASHWMMKEHRVRGGHSLIPGAGYVEIARAALEARPENRPVEIRDIAFVSPFSVNDDESREMRVHINRQNGAFVIAGRSGANGEWEEHSTGVARYGEGEPRRAFVPDIIARCANRVVEGSANEDQHLDFGPRWGNVRKVHFGEDEALVELDLAAKFIGDLDQFHLHPALLDMATASAQSLIPGFNPTDFYIPVSYGRLVEFAPLESRLFSHIRRKESDFDPSDIAMFDVSIMDESGTELVSVTDFMMTRIADKNQLEGDVRRAPAKRSQRRLSMLEDAPEVAGLENAIRPAEGMDAIERVLRADGASRIVVSPEPLAALLARLAAPVVTGRKTEESVEPAVDTSGIESALELHPSVSRAIVVQRRDQPGNQRLVAFFVQDAYEQATVSELRRFLKAKLAPDMVPSAYLPLDELPLRRDGSIDRDALPNPFGANDDFVAPRSDTEKVIAEVWRDVLGVERVSVYDNFFDAGGHSLLSVRVVARVEKLLGVRLNQAIMVLQTLEQIAAECDRRMATELAAATGDEAPDDTGIGRKIFNAFRQRAAGA